MARGLSTVGELNNSRAVISGQKYKIPGIIPRTCMININP